MGRTALGLFPVMGISINSVEHLYFTTREKVSLMDSLIRYTDLVLLVCFIVRTFVLLLM